MKLLLVLLFFLFSPSYAQVDVAQVISRQPRFVTSYQQICTQVPVERKNIGNTILGGVLGAAIGNQIGGGSGKDIATAAGAVIGSSLASDSIIEMQTRCTLQPVQIQQGEVITFEYNGKRFTHTFP